MAALLDSIRAYFEGSIDFEGQRKAENYANVILPSSALVAFFVGFIFQDLRISMAIYAMGIVVALLVVVPPWSMYRQNPIKWLPAGTDNKATSGVQETKKKQ